MTALIITHGDKLNIPTVSEHRTLMIGGSPIITGSGHATIKGKKICVVGDEKKVLIPAQYIATGYPQPGSGFVTITLDSNQKSKNSTTAKRTVILKGWSFTAIFTPTVLASTPLGMTDMPKKTENKGTFQPQQNFDNAT